MTLREEFRLKNFCFSKVSTERFFTSQWRIPGLVYFLYRICTAAYTLTFLTITAYNQLHHQGDLQHWGSYLTNWTYVVLTVYHVLHAIYAIGAFTLCSTERRLCLRRPALDDHLALFHEFQRGIDELGSEESEVTHLSSDVTYFQPPSRWHLNILWILLNVSSTASFMVTLVFWAILAPNMGGHNLPIWINDNIQLHLVNTILVLLEHMITAVPVRILHVIYPFCYALIYLLFSVFYWIPDHSHVMYDILDWGKPGETMGYVLLVGFVILPILHFLLYLFYRLKLKIFSSIYGL